MALYSLAEAASPHAFSRTAMTSSRVATGAMRPPAVNPSAGKPSSRTVGTAGRVTMRSSDRAASTGRLPATATAGVEVVAIAVPVSNACVCGPSPWNGTARPPKHHEMRRGARTGGGVDQILGFGPGELHELVERLERRLRGRDQYVGRIVCQANVAKAIDTVGQLLQVRLRGERIVGGEREGVAVGFCLDEIADAEGSGRTALVVDDDRLSKRLGNLDLQRPGHDVGVSPGRERHDDGNWSRRIGLRHHGRHAADKDAKRNCQKHHVNSPIASADFY